MTYIYLGLAIVLEVLATTCLKLSAGFSKLVPSLIVIIGYSGAFYFLSLCLQNLSIGIVYAIWSGIGIVLTAGVGILFFQQHLDQYAAIGMAFIVLGVVIMNFSSSIPVG